MPRGVASGTTRRSSSIQVRDKMTASTGSEEVVAIMAQLNEDMAQPDEDVAQPDEDVAQATRHVRPRAPHGVRRPGAGGPLEHDESAGGDAGQVDVRPLVEGDLEWLWHWNVEVTDPQWKQWDGPYFGSEDTRTLIEFCLDWRPSVLAGDRAVVAVDGERAGFVSRFPEPPAGGGWWELGIVLFEPHLWGRGVGRRALSAWADQTWDETDAHVLTLTTWSGNERMVRCAAAAGFSECGRVPEARSWQGRRWDSVRMALLRDRGAVVTP